MMVRCRRRRLTFPPPTCLPRWRPWVPLSTNSCGAAGRWLAYDSDWRQLLDRPLPDAPEGAA